MRITPLELRSHPFEKRWGRLDPEEVGAFLDMVAEDFESLTRENHALTDRTYQLEKQVTDLKNQEKLLQETLISAQAMSQDLRQTAVKECEALLSQAELRAEKIVDAGHRRSARLSEEIRQLRELRTHLAASLRACLDTHAQLIERTEIDPEPESEPADSPRVSYHARSSTPAPDPSTSRPETD